jgi:hypothetical protein
MDPYALFKCDGIIRLKGLDHGRRLLTAGSRFLTEARQHHANCIQLRSGRMAWVGAVVVIEPDGEGMLEPFSQVFSERRHCRDYYGEKGGCPVKGEVLLIGATGLISGEIAWRLMIAGRRVWCLVRSKALPTFCSSDLWLQIKRISV